jgi:hypothetical protein
VREEQMPAAVAPECFQAHQSFISRATPELSWAFEAALILATSGLDGSAAQGLSTFFGEVVV